MASEKEGRGEKHGALHRQAGRVRVCRKQVAGGAEQRRQAEEGCQRTDQQQRRHAGKTGKLHHHPSQHRVGRKKDRDFGRGVKFLRQHLVIDAVPALPHAQQCALPALPRRRHLELKILRRCRASTASQIHPAHRLRPTRPASQAGRAACQAGSNRCQARRIGANARFNMALV